MRVAISRMATIRGIRRHTHDGGPLPLSVLARKLRMCPRRLRERGLQPSGDPADRAEVCRPQSEELGPQSFECAEHGFDFLCDAVGPLEAGMTLETYCPGELGGEVVHASLGICIIGQVFQATAAAVVASTLRNAEHPPLSPCSHDAVLSRA
jgi:hypothetical protein